MKLRALTLTSFICLSAPASAADISGTFSATFQGFDTFGVATTRLDLRLSCALVCQPAAPQLHFRVATGTDAWFLSALTTKVGYVSASFGSNDNGINTSDSTQFPAGSAFRVIAKGASCHCGNAVGQGGYIDITAPDTVIPPYVGAGVISARVGSEWSPLLSAQPQGSETVVVRFLGAGIDRQVTLGPTDFTSSGAGLVSATPLAPGDMTVTATLMPYGANSSATVTVQSNSSAGGGAGGGSGGSGGGDAGGGTTSDEGCAAAPGIALLPLALMWVRRRRA